MAIRNRKGNTVGAEDVAPKRKPGRPKKTEATSNKKVCTPKGPVIDPPRVSDGPFHMVFPYHLHYKDIDGSNRNCYFQCEGHMNTHIERYKVDRRKATIGATEPRN